MKMVRGRGKQILQFPSHRARSGYHFPSQRRRKRMSVLCIAPSSWLQGPPQLRCIAMLLLQNMQSGGTAPVWDGTQGKRHRGTAALVQVAGAYSRCMGHWSQWGLRSFTEWVNREREGRPPQAEIPACWQARMKIARASAQGKEKKRNLPTSTERPLLRAFVGCSSSRSIQGTRSLSPRSSPYLEDLWPLASCRLIRHMVPRRSRLARPYMRALAQHLVLDSVQ